MAAAGGVGVGELVDRDDLRSARKDGVEVHLLKHLPLVVDAAARDHLEPIEQCGGLLPAMGLDVADDDVDALALAGSNVLQHLVGLADARRGAEKDLQPPGATFFLSRQFQQRIGRRTTVAIGALVSHRQASFPLAHATSPSVDRAPG